MGTHNLQDEPESTIGSRPMHPREPAHGEAPATVGPEATAAQGPEQRDEGDLRWWLRGLQLPSTRGDVLDLAERNGAPEGVIGFLESLPSAVFTSEQGLEHVLMLLHDEDVPDQRPGPPPASEDGEAG